MVLSKKRFLEFTICDKPNPSGSRRFQRWAVSHGAVWNPLADLEGGNVTFRYSGTRQLDYTSNYWELADAATESQHMVLHSLRWLDPLLTAALAEDEPRSSPHLELLESQVKSWMAWSAASPQTPGQAWFGHPTALRTMLLVGMVEVFPDAAWLHQSLAEHLDYLQDPENFSGYWNHGLTEALALYGAGQILDQATAVDTGRERISGCLTEMIDDQGAINEQATQYSGYILNLAVLCQRAFAANDDQQGLDLATRREAALEDFIRHAITPQGVYAQLGDSFESPPPTHMQRDFNAGLHLPEPNFGEHGRVAVYDRGYVFARSGWGEQRPREQEDYFTFRYGPGRAIHGHNDHLSLTWYTAGHKAIIDSGHEGYTKGPYRSHLQSVQAHSLVEAVGQRHDWQQETKLAAHHQTSRSLYVSAQNTAFRRVSRARHVLFQPRGPLLVWDKLASALAQNYRQLWHLGPEFTEWITDGPQVRVRAPEAGLDLVIHQIPSGRDSAALQVEHWYGPEDSYFGWHSTWEDKRAPNFTVGFTAAGRQHEFLTAIVVVQKDEKVTHTLHRSWRGATKLRLQHGANHTNYRVRKDGMLEQLGR